MADFVFTHPGVKFKERDLSVVSSRVGVTTLGLVGETQKGPAFSPVQIDGHSAFRERFGKQSIEKFDNGILKYPLPYQANAYLEESDQLFVTRVLGLSGYDSGKAWAIKISANVDLTTTGETETTTNIHTFEDNVYEGVTLQASGDTGTSFTGFVKQSDNTFMGYRHDFKVVSYDIGDGSGEVEDDVTTITGDTYQEYDDMVVAVVRSKGRVTDKVNESPQTTFDATKLEIINNSTLTNTGDLFGTFTLKASENDHENTEDNPEEYKVSLDPNATSFISNVLGRNPNNKKSKLWVEHVYPDLIKKLDADGFAYGVKTELIEAETDVFTNYKTQYKTPQTPWVVSQIRGGNNIDRLFRFVSVSDGNSANREIKISILNINPVTREFDILVRDFYDTDDNPVILESFNRCSLIEGETTFIGNRIGTYDGTYPLRSEYISLELSENIEEDVFPSGFEGYWINNFNQNITGSEEEGKAPKMFYKTSYEPTERVNRTYLGITQSAYNGEGLTGRGFNQNMFNFTGYYEGVNIENFEKTNGFHMDYEAIEEYTNDGEYIGKFDVGEASFRGVSDILQPDSPYFEENTRKFTFVPYGGFDGWDVHRPSRTHTDLYREGGIYDGVEQGQTPTNDYQAWETAISTFNNPNEILINIFSTPGLNWSNNTTLVQQTIDMIERERADSLYIIDSPDIEIPMNIGIRNADVEASKQLADLLDATNIDSSYSCTYFPYIQMRDTQNNVYVYTSATGEVLAAIAFTDNTKFPWFAPAGLQRGVTNAIKSKYRLSSEAKKILYSNRINPIVDFAGTGSAIFGQKTLQRKESALDRINVRRLLLRLKVLISNVAIRLVFDQNDQSVVDEFLAQVNPILDNIKNERGLHAFEVVMDDTNNSPETRDRNELYGDIYIQPTRALEKIGIRFNITPEGASFDDLS